MWVNDYQMFPFKEQVNNIIASAIEITQSEREKDIQSKMEEERNIKSKIEREDIDRKLERESNKKREKNIERVK